MLFNIKNAKAEKRSYTREGGERGQNFQLKYRPREDGKTDFTFSNALFNALGLADQALVVVPLPDDDGNIVAVGLVVTPESHEQASMFKSAKSDTGKKGKKVNNSLFADNLIEAGVVEAGEDWIKKNQKLTLTEYTDSKISIDEESGEIDEDPKGFTMYIVTRDEDQSNADEMAEEELEEAEA